jgi:hypothetical protein
MSTQEPEQNPFKSPESRLENRGHTSLLSKGLGVALILAGVFCLLGVIDATYAAIREPEIHLASKVASALACGIISILSVFAGFVMTRNPQSPSKPRKRRPPK